MYQSHWVMQKIIGDLHATEIDILELLRKNGNQMHDKPFMTQHQQIKQKEQIMFLLYIIKRICLSL